MNGIVLCYPTPRSFQATRQELVALYYVFSFKASVKRNLQLRFIFLDMKQTDVVKKLKQTDVNKVMRNTSRISSLVHNKEMYFCYQLYNA